MWYQKLETFQTFYFFAEYWKIVIEKKCGKWKIQTNIEIKIKVLDSAFVASLGTIHFHVCSIGAFTVAGAPTFVHCAFVISNLVFASLSAWANVTSQRTFFSQHFFVFWVITKFISFNIHFATIITKLVPAWKWWRGCKFHVCQKWLTCLEAIRKQSIFWYFLPHP